MDKPKTILVGTDFSDVSDEALRTAALYAKTFGSRVLVAHVFDPTPNVPPVVWSRPDLLELSIRVEIEEAIRETLSGRTASLLKDVPEVELSVCQHPSAGRALCEIAEDEGADLLIRRLLRHAVPRGGRDPFHSSGNSIAAQIGDQEVECRPLFLEPGPSPRRHFPRHQGRDHRYLLAWISNSSAY